MELPSELIERRAQALEELRHDYSMSVVNNLRLSTAHPALVDAILAGDTQTAEALFKAGITLEAREELDQRLVLHHAILNDREEMVALLLAYGLHAQVCDKHQQTPLFYASVTGNRAIAHMLLSRFIPPNTTSDRGITALHRAVELDHYGFVLLLIAHGANVGAYNALGQTPIQVAQQLRRVQIAQLLTITEQRLGSVRGYTPVSPYVIIENYPVAEETAGAPAAEAITLRNTGPLFVTYAPPPQ
jgi:ankyrin repeat protein